MISLKKYLDSVENDTKSVENSTKVSGNSKGKNLLFAVADAYGAALMDIGSCGLNACPALGEELKRNMAQLQENLSRNLNSETVEKTEQGVKAELEDWGRRTAVHYQNKTGEVKEILLVMARTAESVGERDQRCAKQLTDVTTRLKTIANLDDLSLIRVSIEKSAAELRTSVDRMASEGKAAVEQLRAQVSTYQAKLEEAEEIASRDSLTGLRSRMCIESHMERRIEKGLPFCVAIVDIDLFKQVNDEHGHLVGDEVLKQFSSELKSAGRSTDVIGRWGGDEFLILLDCKMEDAMAQSERLTKWVCGDYNIQGPSGPFKLRVDASIGLAEWSQRESLKELLTRADADMYQNKATARKANKGKR
jgi:diguanylate cyclase (GGDEF)-like protein